MHAIVALRLELGHQPVAAVRADDREVRVGEIAHQVDEQLQSFPTSDPADAQHERRVGVEPEALPKLAARRVVGDVGKAVRPDADPPVVDAAREVLVALDVRRRHEPGGASRDMPYDGGVERALEPDLAQLRLVHPERLDQVRHAPVAAPAGDDRPERIPEPEDVRDVGSRLPAQVQRQRRRDSHPPEPGRRREVVNRRSVELLGSRVPTSMAVQINQARREDVDRMAAPHQFGDEPPQHESRPAERVRRPVHRSGNEDSQRIRQGAER